MKMWLSKYLIIILLVFSFIETSAQSTFPLNKGFSLGLTLAYSQYKERLINNLRNCGIEPTLSINYNFPGDINHSLGLDIGFAYLENRYSMSSYIIQYQIKYQITKYIESARLYLGGAFRFSNMFYQADYYDAQHNYWVSHIDCGFSANKNFKINEDLSLSLPLYIPLIGLKSRPADNRQFVLNEPDMQLGEIIKRMNSNYKFAVVGDNLFSINLGVDLKIKLCEDRNLLLGYKLYYDQDKAESSPKYQYLSHGLSITYPF
jgi:hypothetical protein